MSRPNRRVWVVSSVAVLSLLSAGYWLYAVQRNPAHISVQSGDSGPANVKSTMSGVPTGAPANSSSANPSSPSAGTTSKGQGSTNTSRGAGNATQTTTACSLPAYPTPSCTGVPAGTVLADLPLTVDNDSYAATTPGEVIDSKRIHGNLLIWADNVTVKNSYIEGTVSNEVSTGSGLVYHPFTITDSTIYPRTCASAPGPAINGSRYVARRILVFNHDKGFNSSSPGYVQVYDSYAKLCWNPPSIVPPDGSHSGGFDALCQDGTCYNTVFRHNTIDNRNPNGDSGMTYMAFDTLNGAPPNVIDGFTADDNLVMGGAYTIMFWWNGGAKWEVHGNRVVDKAWAYGPLDARNSCNGQNWSGNTLVTIDANYNITSTVAQLPCTN